MKYLALLLLLTACATEPKLPPEGTQVRPPPQWVEYCQREGQEDPACRT